MKRRAFVRQLTASITGLSVPGTAFLHAGSKKRLPNIVFMFADDLGWGDPACYGHPYAKTPAIDKLASEGTRFTQAYVAGVTCCPSRTAVMTGRHAATFKHYPAGHGFGDVTTLTDLLKKHGYRTAHFGKWHIGPETENVYGIETYSGGEKTNNSAEGRDAGLYASAIKYIKDNKDVPFYVNIWGHITHYPVNPHGDLAKRFSGIKFERKDFSRTMQKKFNESEKLGADLKTCMARYLGDVYSLDMQVGKVLKTIDECGLGDNTIVIFSSDHGPAPVLLGGAKKISKEFSANMLGYAGEFRGGKHEQYEGGVRVPFIIRWPGRVKAGATDTTSVISCIDMLPSICSIVGIEKLPDKLDGEDVSDIWLGKQRDRTRPLLWRASSAGAQPSIREGKWKLHLKSQRAGGKPELYDLETDPSESNNVAEKFPEVSARMAKKARAWISTLPKSYVKIEKRKDKKKKKKKG